MGNYERLTKRIGDKVVFQKETCNIHEHGEERKKVYNRLADFEDDLESGKIIRPKYPLYSIVYIIDYIDDKGYSVYGGKPTIRECFVCSISQIAINYPCLYMVQPKELPKDVLEGENENIEYWEKSWFEKDLYETKAEAEKKLKELKEKENGKKL